jgi:hypothetical protein
LVEFLHLQLQFVLLLIKNIADFVGFEHARGGENVDGHKTKRHNDQT